MSTLKVKEEIVSESLLKKTQTMIKNALQILGEDEEIFELIKEPQRSFSFRIPVKMENGSVKVFTGYRVQHNDSVGPTKGGIRFHPDVTEEQIQALSIMMSV